MMATSASSKKYSIASHLLSAIAFHYPALISHHCKIVLDWGAIAPGHTALDADRAAFIPDCSAIVPDHIAIAPDYSAFIPARAASIPVHTLIYEQKLCLWRNSLDILFV